MSAYYRIILDDPWEVMVCAVNEDGRIIGFANTTMDAQSQSKNIKKHRIYLGLCAVSAIIRKPSIIKSIWQRYKSLNNDMDAPCFVNTEGVRGEYWCWLKGEDSLKSVEMSKAKNEILYDLGVREMYFEVDKFNTAVYKFHLKINKGIPIKEVVLPDGRIRVFMKKILTR